MKGDRVASLTAPTSSGSQCKGVEIPMPKFSEALPAWRRDGRSAGFEKDGTLSTQSIAGCVISMSQQTWHMAAMVAECDAALMILIRADSLSIHAMTLLFKRLSRRFQRTATKAQSSIWHIA